VYWRSWNPSQVRTPFHLHIEYLMNVSQEQRHSIIRQSPPNNPRECNRPSSDFSSIGPSQSASQVTLNHGHEEQPLSEPATIHFVMNAPAFGEPSIATTITVAAPTPPPAEFNTNRPRPPSVYRRPERVLRPPPVYTPILTYAAA
jgi:hypothetical protein